MKLATPKEIKRESERAYDSVCFCKIRSSSDAYSAKDLSRPVVKRVAVSKGLTGGHPHSPTKIPGTQCEAGIPVDSALRARALWYGAYRVMDTETGVESFVVEPSGEKRARWDALVESLRSSDSFLL